MQALRRHVPNSAGGSGHVGVPANKLGARLREVREILGFKQADVARLIGTSSGRVSDHELGRRIPTLDVLARYATAFDCTVSELLAGVM